MTSEYGIAELESMVGTLLAQKTELTRKQIKDEITKLRDGVAKSVSDFEVEELSKKFYEIHGVTMTLGAELTTDDYAPWLPDRRSSIDPYYWTRFSKLLVDKKRSPQVIGALDSVTERITGLLENPEKEEEWDRRGLVVGHVQAGKTENYTGLVCKAADAGYKLIVVIAGVHNNLRNQTQERIDEGLIGVDSSHLLTKKRNRYVGVGKYDKRRRPSSFTNTVKDFNVATARGLGLPLQNLKEPAVFVIKKNSTTLKNLLEWLTEHNTTHGFESITEPMLLIDDEADNASINIRYGKDEVAKINGQIRQLLAMFDRSCYVGYTATPFANIFIDPDSDDDMFKDDLFPRDFIVSLDPPSNYFGAHRVFLDDDSRHLVTIDDNEDLIPIKHKIDHSIEELPSSLVDAINCFVVARAVRIIRGQGEEHSSMLVNASRFTGIQELLKSQIRLVLSDIQDATRVMGKMDEANALKIPQIATLKDIFETQYGDSQIKWIQIQEVLRQSAAPINVVSINNKSGDALNYSENKKNGLHVITIGGFSLSRGLTLEGLTVSYFLRNSMMYDTLMQMARWFGYRPGYDDLCRIWMPEDAIGWYTHISESIELLRDELKAMQSVNATPQEFGLKVRRHPSALMVTARSKMGSSKRVVVKVGLGNNFVETHTLLRDEKSLEQNRAAARNLLVDLNGRGVSIPNERHEEAPGFFVRGVPSAAVLKFISEFRNHPGSQLTHGDPIRTYIEERRGGNLATWDLLFTSLASGEPVDSEHLSLPVIPQMRTEGTSSDANTLKISNKQRVASRGVEKVGLTPEEIACVEKKYNEAPENKNSTTNYPDRIYRATRKRPLLIIHLLDVRPAKNPKYKNLAPLDSPVVAWSLSFPKPDGDEEYVEFDATTTWLRENFGDDLDENEMDGDE